ncbi:hypothetical protein VTJ49DRAFT_7294 [Mycothermus thermophilus]|uniref:Uncharacterized protein n=1 Tax=Humicola insolens TaxID=85995 RepID=A0ABR3VID3_HUMIN
MASSNSQAPRYYEVYLLRFELGRFTDPDMPAPRYHNLLFVRCNPDGSGIKFHVTGDITSSTGMIYKSEAYHDFRYSRTLYDYKLLGYTPSYNFHARWDAVLNATEKPPQQKAFNIATMKTEPFKTLHPLTFYQPGEQRRPLWKCTEWTNYKAIPALKAAGLIVTEPSPSPSPPGSRPGSRGSAAPVGSRPASRGSAASAGSRPGSRGSGSAACNGWQRSVWRDTGGPLADWSANFG